MHRAAFLTAILASIVSAGAARAEPAGPSTGDVLPFRSLPWTSPKEALPVLTEIFGTDVAFSASTQPIDMDADGNAEILVRFDDRCDDTSGVCPFALLAIDPETQLWRVVLEESARSVKAFQSEAMVGLDFDGTPWSLAEGELQLFGEPSHYPARPASDAETIALIAATQSPMEDYPGTELPKAEVFLADLDGDGRSEKIAILTDLYFISGTGLAHWAALSEDNEPITTGVSIDHPKILNFSNGSRIISLVPAGWMVQVVRRP
ncbi:hypothetical protein [Amorphus sp. 3PC139-8]|uniref:hypothetical protein n=1 Tax=Amorphus sp. 3PC139-8 TaxID=2735676 RepID=UPI00345C9A44